MNTDLSHLPERNRIELDHVVTVLFEALETMRKNATQPWKKNGRIKKIILFGSFARGSWVHDKRSGYQSDYDILLIVNNQRLAEGDLWWDAEEQMRTHPQIAMPVGLIVEPLREINEKLREGRYFYTDIVDEGVELYGAPGTKLAKPQPKSREEWHAMATEYFEHWMVRSREGYRVHELSSNEGMPLDSVFMLHQATERAYNTVLLTLTLYSPAIHDIEKLRGFAENYDDRLKAIWPVDRRRYKRMFQLLRRAYVEARYSKHYKITSEELEWLGERVKHLIETVDKVCRDRLG